MALSVPELTTWRDDAAARRDAAAALVAAEQIFMPAQLQRRDAARTVARGHGGQAVAGHHDVQRVAAGLEQRGRQRHPQAAFEDAQHLV